MDWLITLFSHESVARTVVLLGVAGAAGIALGKVRIYGVSLGIAGVFIETHQDPDAAPSDGPNMIHLARMPALIARLMAIDALAKSP